MRVGLVTDFYLPWIGGPATVVHDLAHGLASRGHEVSVLAPSPDGRARCENDGPVLVWRARSTAAPVGFNLRFATFPGIAVRRWLLACRPDVVHVHHPFPLSATAILLCRARDIPVVATNHTIPACSLWGIRTRPALYAGTSFFFGQWIAFLLRLCQRVVTPTETAAEELRKLGYRGAVEVISNGVDTRRFRPADDSDELRRRLGLDDRPVVLYTGRLDAEKQMDVWLRAAAAAAESSDVQFVIGGRGTARDALEKLAQRLNLLDRARFLDYVDAEDLPALYRLATVYFVTSPVELQGIATLEAIASGLPVVAVRSGALPELVKDGKNGYLVEPGNWRAAADRLTSLLGDMAQRQSFGRQSRVLAMEHDAKNSLRRYEMVLERTTGLGASFSMRRPDFSVGSTLPSDR